MDLLYDNRKLTELRPCTVACVIPFVGLIELIWSKFPVPENDVHGRPITALETCSPTHFVQSHQFAGGNHNIHHLNITPFNHSPLIYRLSEGTMSFTKLPPPPLSSSSTPLTSPEAPLPRSRSISPTPPRYSTTNPRPDSPASDLELEEPLKKHQTVTYWQGVSLVIGRQIGSGIFSAPSLVNRNAGSLGASLLIWLLSGCLTWTGSGFSHSLSPLSDPFLPSFLEVRLTFHSELRGIGSRNPP